MGASQFHVINLMHVSRRYAKRLTSCQKSLNDRHSYLLKSIAYLSHLLGRKLEDNKKISFNNVLETQKREPRIFDGPKEISILRKLQLFVIWQKKKIFNLT